LIDLGVLEEPRLKEAMALFGPPRSEALVSFIRGRALMITTEAEAAVLRERGFAPTEIMRDTNVLVLAKRALYGPTMRMPEAYHTYGEILALVDSLAKVHPKLIHRFPIGRTSQEDQTIFAVSLTSPLRPAAEKPTVLINGCHHADEVLGAEICTEAIRTLVEAYGRDSAATAWLDALEIVVVPVVNVDGHRVVTSGRDPRWRKNTRDTNGDGILYEFGEGVDLNRNYNFNWAHGGSGDSSSERYRGRLPMSELENRAIDTLARSRRFLLSLTYHSQGEVVYYPWSWRGRSAPDNALLTQIAQELAGSIVTMNGDTCYRAEYGAGMVGQSYPFLYGRFGTFDFVVETGRGSHIFPDEDRTAIVASNLEGIYQIMRRAGGPGIAVHVTDLETGLPLGATVWLPDIDTEEIDRRMALPQSGRHWRLLIPGNHRAIVTHEGYDPAILNDIVVEPEGWTNVNVQMRPSSSTRPGP